MADLPPESKAIYDLLKVETVEEYDARFLEYKTETRDAFHQFVATTGKKIKTVTASVEAVRALVNSDLESVRASIGNDLDAVRSSLSSQIASLTEAARRLPQPDLGTTGEPHRDGGTVGQFGHIYDQQHRGKTCDLSMSPPVRGNNPDRQNFEIQSCSIPFAEY